MDQQTKQTVGAALQRVAGGLFVLTAQHEERRGGVLTYWLQQVCHEPPMLSVAVGKGDPIMPLISESGQFGVCQLAHDDRVMPRKFRWEAELEEDPFLGFELVRETTLDVPLLKNTLACFECSLVCHMDVEGDHDLFVGHIRNAQCHKGEPYVYVPAKGLR